MSRKVYMFRGTKQNHEQVSGLIERPEDDKKFAQELLKAFKGAEKNDIRLFSIEMCELSEGDVFE